jgi:hypothetical protein
MSILRKVKKLPVIAGQLMNGIVYLHHIGWYTTTLVILLFASILKAFTEVLMYLFAISRKQLNLGLERMAI